jgi:hypothetical protein
MPRIQNGPGHLITKNYEVQRANHFEVSIDLASVVDLTGAKMTAVNNDLTLMVETFPLPQIANEPIEISYGNRKVKVAGAATYEGGELTIRDAITKDTEKLVNTWQKCVYDPTTDNIGWAENYKTTATIYEYSPDGSVSRSWKLYGVWPQSVNYGELGYENSEKKTMQVTLSYDYAAARV